MKHRPHISISIAEVAKENGWKRVSLVTGERFIRGNTAIHVYYARDGRIRTAWFYYGPNGDPIKGGRHVVEESLRIFGKSWPLEAPKCSICGRVLDVPGDDASANCGGDCWGCIGPIEKEMQR